MNRPDISANQEATGWAIVAFILAIFAADLGLLYFGGQESTFSVYLRTATHHWGALPYFFALLFGWCLGHWF